jgi:protein-disulfide isomerase
MSHKEHKHDHHDHHNTNKNNNTTILLSVIIVLLIVIAIGAFYLGQTLSKQNVTPINNGTTNTVTQNQVASLEVKVYDDVRCTTCNTEDLLSRLSSVPGLKSANFDKKDFSDSEVEDYLKTNNISALPLIIFPTNFIDPGLNDYLKPIGNGEFFLDVNADFDPFAKRSENWLIMLNEDDLATLKQETNYFMWNKESQYAWFEYTNFACPACVQFHKSGVHDQVLENYGDKMKFATKHFHFFDAAYPAAEVIECAADQLGDDGFYALEKNIFIDGILTVDALSEKAIELWANKSELNACLESDKHIQTYESVKDNGARIFGVSATPTNILVNLETGEFMKSQNVGSDIQKFIWE